jgi:hypothetical protein
MVVCKSLATTVARNSAVRKDGSVLPFLTADERMTATNSVHCQRILVVSKPAEPISHEGVKSQPRLSKGPP